MNASHVLETLLIITAASFCPTESIEIPHEWKEYLSKMLSRQV